MFERRRKIKIFISNIPLAILSLVIAGGLWFYVVSGEIIEVNLDLPIRPDLPQDICVVSYKPRIVTLYVKGKKRQVMILKRCTLRVPLEKEINIGKMTVPLDKDHVKFPVIVGEVEFRVMGKEEMVMDVDSLIRKKVKVILSNGLKTEPDSVLILGPARYIKNVTSVLTDSVPVKGNYTTISLGGKLIKVIPSVVKVVP